MTFQFLGNPWMMKLLKRKTRKIDVRFPVGFSGEANLFKNLE